MKNIFSKINIFNNNVDFLTIDSAAEKTRGGSGNATEFGRPQGRNK